MNSTIPDEVVEQFKEKIKITHSAEDSNLKRILSFSYAYLQGKCGDFELTENKDSEGKELVFERSRYVYNDAGEYFEENFLSRINALAFDLLEGELDA